MSNRSRNNFLNILRTYFREIYNNNRTGDSQPNNATPNTANSTTANVNNQSSTLEGGSPNIIFFLSILEPDEVFNPVRNVSLLDYTLRIRLNTLRNDFNSRNTASEETNTNEVPTNQLQNIDNIIVEPNETINEDTNGLRARIEEVLRHTMNRTGEGEDITIPRFRHLRIRSDQERASQNQRFPYVIVFDVVRNNTTVSIEFHSDELTIIDNIAWLGEFGFSQSAFQRNILKPNNLKKLKTHRICKKGNKNDCPICLNKFKYREMARTLPCEHVFHSKCVDKWLLRQSNACPICRKVVDNEQVA